MHQPSAEPRPSIYYKYQVHQPWLPSKHPRAAPQGRRCRRRAGGPGRRAGARSLGVRSVVLNAELQVSQGGRAIVFTRRSMEILHQVGVARRVAENGLPWRFGNSFYRGQRVFRMEAPHDADDRFFP